MGSRREKLWRCFDLTELKYPAWHTFCGKGMLQTSAMILEEQLASNHRRSLDHRTVSVRVAREIAADKKAEEAFEKSALPQPPSPSPQTRNSSIAVIISAP